jgi:hypothetical protein
MIPARLRRRRLVRRTRAASSSVVKRGGPASAAVPAEADDDVPGEARVDLGELAAVQHVLDDVVHVVGLVGGVGDHRVAELSADGIVSLLSATFSMFFGTVIAGTLLA